jgi:hypothetical protein
MKTKQTVVELRAALMATGRKGAGRPYPEVLRRAAVMHLREREREGGDVAGAAAELGVSGTSLVRWSHRTEVASKGFRAVEVIGGPAETSGSEIAAQRSAIVVHGPRGVRVEGLTVADVAELVGRLS